MHAIDFGAGSISGIGPLTAWNLNGYGVHIIVTMIPVAPPLPADLEPQWMWCLHYCHHDPYHATTTH